MSNDLLSQMQSMRAHTESIKVTPTYKEKEVLSNALSLVAMASPFVSFLLYSTETIIVDEPQTEPGEGGMPQTAFALMHDKGFTIAFYRSFLSNIINQTPKVAFVLYHEALHIFGRHADIGIKAEIKSPIVQQLWHYATDYYINYMASGMYRNASGSVSRDRLLEKNLKVLDLEDMKHLYTDEQYKKLKDKESNGCLLDEKYVGMSEFEIFEELKKEVEKKEGKSLAQIAQEMQDEQDKIDALLDKIFNGRPVDLGEYNDDGSSPEAIDANIESAQRRAMTAAEQNSNSISKSDQGLMDVVRDKLKPKIRWQDRTFEFVSQKVKEDRTYSKFNRRSCNRFGVIYPSSTGEHVNLVIGIDSSGSMGRDTDLVRCYTETIELLSRFPSFKAFIVTCDTKAHLIEVLDSDTFNPETYELNVKGGGGTEMQPLYDYAMEIKDEEDISCCVIMTDGWISESDLQIPDYGLETLVMVTDGGKKDLSRRSTNLEIIRCD